MIAGCDGQRASVVIEARTDAVPGIEFTRARADLVAGSDFGTGVRLSAELDAARDQDWVFGQRVASIGDLEPGTYVIRVQLLEPSGGPFLERFLLVRFSTSHAVTVLLTRSCDGVSCLMPGGVEGALTCVGGRCVESECGQPGAPACPSECVLGAECPTGAACADAVCDEGACLLVGRDSRCMAAEYCHPSSGCLPLPDGGMDAGVDAGPDPVDAGIDAGFDAGVLAFWYRDVDMDTYGDDSALMRGVTQPSGYVSRGGDCDDTDMRANPGQTRYFTTPRTGGGWDFNCDLTTTRRITSSTLGFSDYMTTLTTFPLMGCTMLMSLGTAGWVGTAPDCGESRQYRYCHAYSDTSCNFVLPERKYYGDPCPAGAGSWFSLEPSVTIECR